jgi:hypothetical protein
MPELPDVEEIIRTNPNVDPKALEAGRELLRQLREQGIRRSPHKLASPLHRRRALVDDDSAKDPRTVQLRTHR